MKYKNLFSRISMMTGLMYAMFITTSMTSNAVEINRYNDLKNCSHGNNYKIHSQNDKGIQLKTEEQGGTVYIYFPQNNMNKNTVLQYYWYNYDKAGEATTIARSKTIFPSDNSMVYYIPANTKRYIRGMQWKGRMTNERRDVCLQVSNINITPTL